MPQGQRKAKNPVNMTKISKAPQVIQEPETAARTEQEVSGVLPTTGKDLPEMPLCSSVPEKPAASTTTLSIEEIEVSSGSTSKLSSESWRGAEGGPDEGKKTSLTAPELQEKVSDSPSEHTEPSETAPSEAGAWIWPENFCKNGMIYIDNEGEYWALTRPPRYTGPMSNPNLMCLIRIRSEFVSAYSTGEHKKIYDCFDEQALKQPSKFVCPIKIWTPNEGDGFYVPTCMRQSEIEESKKPEELNPPQVPEQQEMPKNFAESKKPDESMKTAESQQPEQIMRIAESEKAEVMKIADSGRPVEAMETAESKRPEDVLKASEFGKPVEAMETTEIKRPHEAVKVEQSGRPVEAMKTAETKRPEETLKDAESGRPEEALRTVGSKRPEEALKVAESGRPVEAMKSAEFKRPEEPLKVAESGSPEEPLKAAEIGRPIEAMKTAESKRPEETLKTAEAGRPVEVMKITQSKRPEGLKAAHSGIPAEDIKIAEAVELKKAENPKLAMKVDEHNKPGNPGKSIIPEKIEQPENSAKHKRSRIPKDLEEPNIIKRARKAFR